MKTLKKPTSVEGIKKKNEMETLVTELLHAVTKIHMAHLRSKSYAAHKALGEFYEILQGSIDTVIEQYQGATQKLIEYQTVTVDPINTTEDSINYLKKLHQQISVAQENCMYSEINNQLDELKSLIDSTLYKLIFLK